MNRFASTLVVLVGALLLPTVAFAQASLTGVVRDSSGAVLPGVTVEATSPVLIEKARSTVTDGNGRYQLANLRPGDYAITFTLAGFNTMRREGVTLSGSATASVDAELRVGALEETVRVTADASVVDAQSATRQAVLGAEVVDALPTSRNVLSLARLIPGTSGGGPDVGGTQLQDTGFNASLTVHGSRAEDQRVTLNGINASTIMGAGNIGGQLPDVGSASEVTIDHTAVSAELATGGVRINIIPKDGGNMFTNATFFTFSNSGLQGSNFTQDLKDAGLAAPPNEVKRNFDINASLGGPFRPDRVWFWFSTRYTATANYVPVFVNNNAFDPTQWLYDPDTSQRGVNEGRAQQNSLRVTWQATPRNKIAATYKADRWCQCPNAISATRTPEAAQDRRFPRLRQEHLEWTSPVTSRLLVEAVAMHLFERNGNMHLRANGGSLSDPAIEAVQPELISVTEQSTGMTYRSYYQFNNAVAPSFSYRIAAAYVTGTHSAKVGFSRTHGYNNIYSYALNPVSYRFNQGVPNQITLRATPRLAHYQLDNDIGLFAQDRWTLGRLTANLAVRYDYFATSFPEQHMEPGPLVPSRDLVFPAQDNQAWHDVTYRSGLTYGVGTDGRTVLKVTLNRYLRGQGLISLGSDPNAVNTLVNETTRSWTDGDRDFTPDCDLTNPNLNGECGAMANRNFGTAVAGATYDPDLLTGWGHREYNWEFSAGLQHEILPRVAVDVGYFRRIWGNFRVTDNLALAPADFDTFSITTPTHAELPGGGGQTLQGIRDLKPEAFGRPDRNYNTLSDKYGRQIEHWNGMDVTVNARLQDGLTLQFGTSTGKTTEDNCEIIAKLPELSITGEAGPVVQRPLQFCHRETPWLTSVKGYATYTIPRIDVQASGTFRSTTEKAINANFAASNAYLAANSTLGRSLAGGASNVTIAMLQPYTKYIDRRNELDLRFGKVVRVGRARSVVSVDLYNVLNTDAAISVNESFATWLQPTEVLNARLMKISVQFDF